MKLIITQKPPVSVHGTGVVKDPLSQTIANVRNTNVQTAWVDDDKVEDYIRGQTSQGRVCHTFSYEESFRAEVNIKSFSVAA